jgi:hypothetical protein
MCAKVFLFDCDSRKMWMEVSISEVYGVEGVKKYRFFVVMESNAVCPLCGFELPSYRIRQL